MTAHVLLNPAARGGRNRHLRAPLTRALARAGLDAEVTETAGPGDARRLARAAGQAGRLVVAAGGDGTVHEVVNGLAGTGGTLAVLPLGTGNDYAHALGMPDGLDAALAAVTSAPARAVDLGCVWWTDARGDRQSRAFANCVGVGFDAHAAALAAETKWIGGRAAYFAAVLRTLWTWRRPGPSVRVQSAALAEAAGVAVGSGSSVGLLPDGPEAIDFEGPLFLCEIGNGHSIGGGFLITPDARLDDGLFDVCLVRHIAPRRALQLLPRSLSGSHTDAPEVTMARTRSVTLVTAGAARGVGVQADGETLACDAVRVSAEIEPGALAVRAPASEPEGHLVATNRYNSYHPGHGTASLSPRI